MSAITIIRPGEAARLDPSSSGFAHGFGIFETMRVSDGHLAFWQRHWQRLLRSAEALGLDCLIDPDEALSAIRELASELGSDATVKLSLLKEADSSCLFVYSRPRSDRPESTGLMIDRQSVLNDRSPLAGHKTHNYTENLILLAAAREAGCYDAARFNTKGLLAEACISNLFLVVDGALRTPDILTGLLPGVIRGVLLDTIEIGVTACSLEDLTRAEAVYLTNTSHGVLPVEWLSYGGVRTRLQSAEHPVLEKMQVTLKAQADAEAVVL
ncbi:MAG: aminotransferase class IV [Verrucomicrobiota bacterium]